MKEGKNNVSNKRKSEGIQDRTDIHGDSGDNNFSNHSQFAKKIASIA